MKSFLLILFSTILFSEIFAQEFDVPKNLRLDKPDDYAKYENDIIQGFNWLMQTPINKQKSKRTDINTFMIRWITGNPNIAVDLEEKIVTFMQPNPDLLMIFIGAWVKYALETKDYKNKLKCNFMGIKSVIEFYQKNKDKLQIDKNVEKYIEMDKNGTLEKYIKENKKAF